MKIQGVVWQRFPCQMLAEHSCSSRKLTSPTSILSREELVVLLERLDVNAGVNGS